MSELRSLVKIDQLQPQAAAYLSKSFRVELPDSICLAMLDITPAPAAEQALNRLLKGADVSPNVVLFDGRGGWIGFHSSCVDEIQSGIDSVLDDLGLTQESCKQPKCLAPELISRIDPRHAAVISSRARGASVEAGESLFVADFIPATAALLAANVAETSATIRLVDFKATGSSGRLYIAGADAEVRCAMQAVIERMR